MFLFSIFYLNCVLFVWLYFAQNLMQLLIHGTILKIEAFLHTQYHSIKYFFIWKEENKKAIGCETFYTQNVIFKMVNLRSFDIFLWRVLFCRPTKEVPYFRYIFKFIIYPVMVWYIMCISMFYFFLFLHYYWIAFDKR